MSVTVTRGTIDDHEAAIKALRLTVFVEEQQVPIDIEMDDRDAYCRYAFAHIDDTLAGAGRIDLEKEGKIGRVAVYPQYRHQGIGRAIMAALEQEAASRGLTEVWMHAQESAFSFYEVLGYRHVDALFQEAGIVHGKMVKALSAANA